MVIETRTTNVPFSDALRDHVQRRVGRALGRFRDRVARVTVRLTDQNGPRGGIDKLCKIVVELVPSTRLVVAGKSDDAYVAVSRASTRLDDAVARVVGRHWHD